MIRKTIVGCSAVLLLSLAAINFGAANSDVADAVMKGDQAAITKLLAAKADVNAPQVDGTSAVHWAVFNEDEATLDKLIAAGAKVKVANREGATPLAMASLYGKTAIVSKLLKAGADAKERGPNGETMLMFAARNGNPETIKVLVAAGIDVNAKESIRGTTALMWAAEQSHPSAVKALLDAKADFSLKSAGAGVPNAYMAPGVNKGQTLAAQQARGVTPAPELVAAAAAGGGGGRGGGRGGGNRGGVGAGGAGAAAGVAAGGAPPLPAAAAINDGTANAATAVGANNFGGNRGGGGNRAAGGNNRNGGNRAGGVGGVGGVGGAGGTGGQAAGGAATAADDNAPAADDNAADDNAGPVAGATGQGGGGLTALLFACRQGDLESVKLLLAAGADINQASEYGWTPVLTATENRHYILGKYLIDRGANVNLANRVGWTNLYLATDNRNIEGGDFPVPKPDMDTLEYIRILLDHKAEVNARINANTMTRTIFTMQWFQERGATAFIRAAQSSDVELMKLLLERGADPKLVTDFGDTALLAACGIGWVEGVTYEWSRERNLEAVKMLLDLGLDPNHFNSDGRTPLMGSALKGRNDVIQLLVDRGAKLDWHDFGSRDTDKTTSKISGHTWQAVDYAEGLVRVGVQSAVFQQDTAKFIRKLMKDRGMVVPAENRNVDSICIVDGLCKEPSKSNN